MCKTFRAFSDHKINFTMHDDFFNFLNLNSQNNMILVSITGAAMVLELHKYFAMNFEVTKALVLAPVPFGEQKKTM